MAGTLGKEMSMTTCVLCGRAIGGRSVRIWTQSTYAPGAPSDAPLVWHDAHPDCAAMLDEDEDDDEQEEEET